MYPPTTSAEWRQFLSDFAVGTGGEPWASCVGASEEKILRTERRLKIQLPPSYRAFLAASNGLINTSRAVPVLRPVENLKWFRREHRAWVQAYTTPLQGIDLPLPAEREYFDYSSESRASFDNRHLAETLCVSDVGDSAVLLLNPMVVSPDGEWEAWLFADWLPGAVRYRSFGEWMRHTAAERRNEVPTPLPNPGELPTVYLDGPNKAPRRIRPREALPSLEEVRKQLSAKTRSHRVRAVQRLCRLDGPAAVTMLLDLLAQDPDLHVRSEAAASLGKMRASEAIEPLIAQIVEGSEISDSAIAALGYFKDERSAQVLLDLLHSNLSAGVAAYALAARGDSRGAQALADLLISSDPNRQSTAKIAGALLAGFEEAGFEALARLITSTNDEVRLQAFLGLDSLVHLSKARELSVKARKLMEDCFEREGPGKLREWMKTSLGLSLPVAQNAVAER